MVKNAVGALTIYASTAFGNKEVLKNIFKDPQIIVRHFTFLNRKIEEELTEFGILKGNKRSN